MNLEINFFKGSFFFLFSNIPVICLHATIIHGTSHKKLRGWERRQPFEKALSGHYTDCKHLAGKSWSMNMTSDIQYLTHYGGIKTITWSCRFRWDLGLHSFLDERLPWMKLEQKKQEVITVKWWLQMTKMDGKWQTIM